MKLFEGKNPAERNKLIAAIILGSLAFLVVGYNFYGIFFAGKPKSTTTAKSNSNSNSAANTNTKPNSNDETAQILEPLPPVENINAEYEVSPVLYSPLDFMAPIGSRNIFAFYEPPPPTPYVEIPKTPPVIKTPDPTPVITPPPPIPPNVMLGFMSPQMVYAGSKGFRLELNGDKFTPETLIIINGMQIPTNFVSGQRLTADIPASMIAGAGNLNIEVKSLDGKLFSNMMSLSVQQAPQPDFDYVGLVSRQRANNDTAYLLAKNSKDPPIGVRLNDTVGGRFKVISISNKEVVLKDKDLGFEYRKPLFRTGQNGSSGSRPGSGGTNNQGFPNNPQVPIQQIGPNGQPCPPGIPCMPQQNNRKVEQDDGDEDDDGI